MRDGGAKIQAVGAKPTLPLRTAITGTHDTAGIAPSVVDIVAATVAVRVPTPIPRIATLDEVVAASVVAMFATPLLPLRTMTPRPLLVLATTLAGANVVVAAATAIIVVVPATVVLRVVATPNVVIAGDPPALSAGRLRYGYEAGRERD